MRLSLILLAATRGLPMVLAAGAASVALGAQGLQSPSLSGAVSQEAAGVWSGDAAAIPGTSSLADEYLQPVPLDDSRGTSGGESCSSCNGGAGGCGGGGYPFNRCGCNPQLFPWISGPGASDDWCVGPHWNVEAEGMALRRTGTDWDPIIGAVGLPPDLIDDFGYAPGVRLFVTGYNDSDFGLQIGYEGVDQFNATATFPDVGSVRSFDYSSSMHSLEINVLRRSTLPLKVFGGFRYVQLGEDFVDALDENVVLPAPATPPTVATFTDSNTAFLLENRLIGVQLGALRDAWQLNRWITLEPYANAGVYINDFKRLNRTTSTDTVISSDDPATPLVNEFSVQTSSAGVSETRNFSDIAFLGETGVSAVIRVSRCVALRGGYQVLAIDGVSEGSTAFFNPGFESSTVVYHGARFGLEYQR